MCMKLMADPAHLPLIGAWKLLKERIGDGVGKASRKECAQPSRCEETRRLLELKSAPSHSFALRCFPENPDGKSLWWTSAMDVSK